MGNNKPRTIDEFFIERYLKLEEENRDLKAKAEMCKKRYDDLKNTFEELGEDFSIRIGEYDSNRNYITFNGTIFDSKIEKAKYDKYKKLFNLKEEGEEDNEQ